MGDCVRAIPLQMAKNFPQKRDVPRQMSGVTWVDWSCPDHPVVHLFWSVLKQCVTRKQWKFAFQSSNWNIQSLDKKRSKHCKGYHQGLLKAYINNTIHISPAATMTSFDFLSSTAKVTSITSTKQESVIGSGKVFCTRSNSKNHKLCQYFLLDSFQKKTTLVQIC